MFIPGKQYTKNDIYKELNVPVEKTKGAWNTGYTEYKGNIYIFSNIGMPGRTGHDYANYWDGILFYWEAKNNSKLNSPFIQKMIDPNYQGSILLFTRTDNRDPFVYEGNVKHYEHHDGSPVKITWKLISDDPNSDDAQEINLYEGTAKKISINRYERNPQARRICISHYGVKCQVCDFDFESKYGDIGIGFIHVHHITPISELGTNYLLNPIRDLVPVCANCHAMLHKITPPYTIQELQNKISNKK